MGKLVLAELAVGSLIVERLELEVTDLGTDPGVTAAERFQRRRTRLRGLAVRMSSTALDERIEQVRRPLAGLGLTQVSARINDGYISVRARAADGLAAADLSFRIQLVSAGAHLRALGTTVRVHGHLPTPGPVIADRILGALLGATDTAGVVERPHTRGLCDVEIDLVGALLWQLMPPSGWRLPAVADIELTSIKLGRHGIDIGYGPVGTRSGEHGVRPDMQQLAAAHDLMHSVDQHLRDGHLEDAMRGYRALLASNGPDQPLLLERILAIAAARPAWFFDGLELSRQALGRWPQFPAAHAALASITLAQGDAREAASHLMQIAQLASAEGDDDQAALAALAGARLLRVLEPKAATQLYQLALEHDPSSSEAADSLADRLADEQRWSELVRLVRARAANTTDQTRAVQLRLRLADVFMHQLDDPAGAQQELAAARQIAPDEPTVHEMTATILASRDPSAAVEAWREVARLAEARGDTRTCGRAWATLGELLAKGATSATEITAEDAWRRALEHDGLQVDALAGLANAAAARGDHAAAAKLYERLRGLGLAQVIAARYELSLARSLVALNRVDDARISLRRATLAGGETAAEAHAVLAGIAEATSDRDHAAAELDTAISSFVDLANEDEAHDGDRLYTRAAELAIARATLLDRNGQASLASADWQRAHELAHDHSPALARDAARTMLGRAGDDAHVERRWIDAVLATRPPAPERAALLVRRADVRRRERTPDLAAALADLHEALALTEDGGDTGDGPGTGGTADPQDNDTRRRAYQLEAELLAQSGDRRARAQALASLARMAERAADRVEVETAAAAAWLAADEPAAALPHGARAMDGLRPDVPAVLRREVLVTLGEAAWRQRSWVDVIRAYRGLIEDPGAEAPRLGTFRYRLAVAADRSGDSPLAIATLEPLVSDHDLARGVSAELRGQALRLFADLAERAGDLAGAATALESFASLAVDSSASARADAIYRAGELFRRAERGDDAIRCLESALRISEMHLPALDALEAAWRERGDSERVSVILGRKVAATTRHPARQKPLLSRLGDLQAQLGRPDVALATHQRALEIDPTWRPSLRYVTHQLREAGQLVAAAGGLAQLAGDLPGDSGVDLAIIARERQVAAAALAELVTTLDDAQLAAVRELALPALERASLDSQPRGRSSHAKLPVNGARTVSPEPSATNDHGNGSGNGSTTDATAAAPSVEVPTEVVAALARLRGETSMPNPPTSDQDTASGRLANAPGTALNLRDAAIRARAAGKLDDALATLETANHVNPGDPALLRELVELATQLADHEAAARHLAALAELQTGAARGNAQLELADIYYDQLDLPPRGREAMRAAAEAFGSGARRDSTLRMLASEASAHLAWDITVEALAAIAPARRNASDTAALATALVRAGRDAEGMALLEEATQTGQFDDGGELLDRLRGNAERKGWLARSFDARARSATPDEAEQLRAEATEIRSSIGAEPETIVDEPSPPRTKTAPGLGAAEKPPAIPVVTSVATPVATEGGGGPFETEEPTPVPRVQTLGRLKLISLPSRTTPREITSRGDADERAAAPQAAVGDGEDDGGWQSVLDPAIKSGKSGPVAVDDADTEVAESFDEPSVVVTGTEDETARALAAAAASADRDRLLAARRENPDDPSMLLALLAHLGDREPSLRREVLDEASRTSTGRALAIALHELALIARGGGDALRASTLWARAYEIDRGLATVWMPLADALAAADDLDAAIELYEKVAASSEYDEARRAFAADRAKVLGRDDTVVSGEIRPRGHGELARARELAEAGDLPAAIDTAQRAAERAPPGDFAALELLETLYLERGDVTAASEAIGRQLVAIEDPAHKAILWRRRAKIYRGALNRDAEAYRCLKEAHACSPADPEISYQLRVAAMVRGEWALAASLLYREIAAAHHPRERGALHLELALIYEERLDDDAQAQVNYEQALTFDPSIPAAKLPLAQRYEAIGRHDDAAKLFEEAATTVRPADRAKLLAAAAKARAAVADEPAKPEMERASGRWRAGRDVALQLERAEASGDLDLQLDLAHQLWRLEPGHPVAFRVLANGHRASGDLGALSELTAIRAAKASTIDERAAAWLELARLADEIGAFDHAARAYDQALVENPTHAGALDARGALAFRLGDYAVADQIYRNVAAGESVLGADELALRRSIIAEKLRRDSEALALAQAARLLAPTRRDVVWRVHELATRMGELDIALDAACGALDLVPLDDDEAQIATHFTVVDLLRQAGKLDGAIGQLDRVVREHPLHAHALEQLAQLHSARGDWTAATRYLYQLVPLAANPAQRAERLYHLGEAVLVHLGDPERADDIFLRASDLEPNHQPTLRRLIDVYWRADDPGAVVEVATELGTGGALVATPGPTLARALVAAALLGDTALAQSLGTALGDDVARGVASALGELEARDGRLQLGSAATAIGELGRRGVVDVHKIRAAASAAVVAALANPG